MPITLSLQQLSDLYRQSRGFGENALSMLTGGIGEPVAGFASLAALARGENAAGARDAVRDAFTYSPRTAEGQGQQRMLGELAQSAMNSAPVRTWQRGDDYSGSASPQAGAVIIDGDLKRIADFRKKDDMYQFENSDEFYSALNDFVQKNSANDAFEGMILPTGHGQHNGFLMITPSAKKEGAWQVTHTDKNYMPISDEGIQTKSQALESFAKYSNPELWRE